MIAWLFFVFLGVGLVLTVAGFAIDIPVLTFIGTIMLFLLGLNLMSNGLDYKTGEVEGFTYSNNLSSHFSSGNYSLVDNSTAYVVSSNITAIYTNYDDTSNDRYGWFLMIGGALAFAGALFMLGRGDD
jgi:hypothetical protein